MQTYEYQGTRYRVREKDLKNKQTDDNPRVLQIRREFAEHPSSGLTPAKLSTILRNAEQGDLIAQSYLAEDLEEKDGHIQAELFKRRMAISDVDWTIEPPTNASAQEQQDADELQQMLRDVEEWHDILFGMSDGILKGFSNTQYCWGNYQNWRIPQEFEHLPCHFFQLHQDDQREIVLRDATGKGEPLQPFTWIQHQHRATSGYPSRIGLVRQLSWPFIFKNYSVRDLAEFLEIYGIPVRIGKYPSGATDNEKRDLMNAVLSVGHNAGGIMPKGMEMEFHEAAKGSGGGGDAFMTMISWCERIQSKVIVGQTLTAQVDSTGSQALGNVHNEVRKEIRDHDMRQIASTLNRDLILPMYMLNGRSYTGDPRRKPRIVFDTQEPEDLKLYSDALPALTKLGMRIPIAYAHEKLRIPQAEGDEPVLTMSEAKPVDKHKGADKAALKMARAALKATNIKPQNPEEDGVDDFTARLRKNATPAMQKWMQPIEDMVQSAESLEQLLDDLMSLESELDESEFAQVLATGMAAAELAGRFDVNEGE